MTPPINKPINPSMHPPIGGDVSTNYKSLNGIALSQLGQDHLNFE